MSKRKKNIAIILGSIALFFSIFGYFEFKTSYFQARYLSRLAAKLTYHTEPGVSNSIRFPKTGPYDIRLGYTHVPDISSSLIDNGYVISEQAHLSKKFTEILDKGLFAIYREKTATGLTIADRTGAHIYDFIRPQRLFKSFDEIPAPILKTLLFIENREILDFDQPKKNPAVEWDRFGKAIGDRAIQEVFPQRSSPGGSTLATQTEKFRHSDEGITRAGKDKIKQMMSASLRAYLDGEDTRAMRKEIVLNYINSIPLAALPGYGEVTGLGDGLWAWYDTDFSNTIATLKEHLDESDTDQLKRYALAYKQTLSLFIAHRRPSDFLLVNVDVLNSLTDEYLELLANAGILSQALKNAALDTALKLRSTAPPPSMASFVDRKAANAVRTQLLRLFGIDRLTFYRLDHFDLNVSSTFDKKIQSDVSAVLGSLKTREEVEKIGLTGEHTLGQGDPSKVIYSMLLYEHVPGGNLLRIQTDNVDVPFDLNEGARLDLGSTAKLRTLVTYLEIVSRLRDEFIEQDVPTLKARRAKLTDPISQWVADYVLANPENTLAQMLDEAMERHYSASPSETFFTGGGVHNFHNFKSEDNGKVPSISESIRFSINLPFVRLMRDLIKYYMAQIPGSPTRSDDEQNNQGRKIYLAKFADKEGSYFLDQFYQKYKKLPPQERFNEFLHGLKLTPTRVAAIYRYVYPLQTIEEFKQSLLEALSMQNLTDKVVDEYYEKYGPGKFSLQDQGYLARVHPLELWLVRFLMEHPNAKFSDAQNASAAERQEVYDWLFKTKYRAAQDMRIKVLIETEAFLELYRDWKRVGYPFSSIVPSLATAIGSSGDRPAALAELVGIILNDGVKYPVVKVDGMVFGAGTPYETRFKVQERDGVQIIRPEIARRVKLALIDIATNGTARRVNGAFKDVYGNPIVIGGKTGTGDHRFDTFGKGGQLISSRVVNRTATFVFFIGERFFGVISGHVHGEEAAKYDFTSALAAGLLKALAPALSPLVAAPPPRVYQTTSELLCSTGKEFDSVATATPKFIADYISPFVPSSCSRIVDEVSSVMDQSICEYISAASNYSLEYAELESRCLEINTGLH